MHPNLLDHHVFQHIYVHRWLLLDYFLGKYLVTNSVSTLPIVNMSRFKLFLELSEKHLSGYLYFSSEKSLKLSQVVQISQPPIFEDVDGKTILKSESHTFWPSQLDCMDFVIN
jgi:hypothetical protein